MNQLNTPKMNLNVIRTLVILGQSKSIYEGMKKLKVDRATITRHLEALEKIFNTKIYNIVGKKFCLTEDGKKIFEGYEKAYNLLFITEKNFLQEKDLNNGKLTIGVSNDVDSEFISQKITQFKSLYPNVVIKIMNLYTDDLFEKLSQYYMDFIIDTPKYDIAKSKKIKIVNIDQEEFCFAYSNKFSKLEINSIKDLDNLPLILPITAKKERIELDDIISNEGINKNISLELDNYEKILDYIKQGIGVGLIPKRLLKNEDLFSFDIDIKKDLSIAFIEDNLCPSAKEFLKLFNIIL